MVPVIVVLVILALVATLPGSDSGNLTGDPTTAPRK